MYVICTNIRVYHLNDFKFLKNFETGTPMSTVPCVKHHIRFSFSDVDTAPSFEMYQLTDKCFVSTSSSYPEKKLEATKMYDICRET